MPGPGSIIWVDFGATPSRVQAGRRPAIVVSSRHHLETVTQMLMVVPCTTRDRGWPNHIPVTGKSDLTQPTFAMTEQVHTIARTQVLGLAGGVDADCLQSMSAWVGRWLA